MEKEVKMKRKTAVAHPVKARSNQEHPNFYYFGLLTVSLLLCFLSPLVGQSDYNLLHKINQCERLLQQGYIEKASANAKVLFSHRHKNGSPKNKARLSNLLGDCYFDREQIDSAFFYHKSASSLFSLHRDSALLAATWLKLGNCYEAQFNPITALRYYNRVFKWSKAHNDHQLFTKALVTIALSKERQGNFDSAEGYLQTAMDMIPQIKDPYLIEQTRFNYNDLLNQLYEGKYHKNIITTNYLNIASACDKYQYKWLKARVCVELSKTLDPKNALEWALLANAISKEILPAHHPYYAVVYKQLAELYGILGKPSLSISYFRKALRISRKHYGFPHVALWDIYLSLAVFQQDTSTESKIALLDSALYCFNLRPNGEALSAAYKRVPLEALEVLVQKALICAVDTTGKYDQLSVKIFQKVIALCEEWRKYYVTPNQRRQFQKIVGRICNLAVNGCWKLYAKRPKQIYVNWAFAFSERGKYVALQEQILKKQLTREEDKWVKQIDSLEHLLSSINSKGSLLAEKKIQIEQSLEKAQGAWLRTDAGRKFDSSFVPITINQLSKALHKKEVFISYYFTDTLYAFVVDKNNAPHFHCLNYNKTTIRGWKKLSSVQNSLTRQFKTFGKEIYDDLVLPLAIPPSHQVLIAPHGHFLSNLPFEALITEENENVDWNKLPYWLNSQKIAYQPSASVWHALKQHKRRQPIASFLGVAPNFRQINMPCFGGAPLAQNVEEVKKLDNIMASQGIGSSALIGYTDKLDLLNQLKKSPSIVHFSTHGKPFADSLPAGLILNCRPDGSCRECILQYEEIAALNMSQTAIITFSACSTADGDEALGEGMNSMVYAFMQAGVRNAVPTLHAVNEGSAGSLFEKFYKNLLHKKKSPLEALFIAKREMKDILGAQPSNWAAFVYFGPDDDLIIPAKNNYLLYSGLFFVAMVLLWLIIWLRQKVLIP